MFMMNMKTSTILLLALGACSCIAAEFESGVKGPYRRRPSMVEKERPELNEETRRLIAAYRKNPTEANKAALRRQVEANYDRVIARKKAKLEEVRREAKHQSLVTEMEEIVAEVINERERRIEQSMRRFTDPRLRPGVRESKDGFLPVIGAAEPVSIAYTPVTNAEYATFVRASGHRAPKHWGGKSVPAGLEEHPVVYVSYTDAVAYCKWMSEQSGVTYRLPSEEEWELAAGHMPKDADFNSGEHDSTTPVTAYSGTLAACGAIDMWGNCWEWTTQKTRGSYAVKGGSWKSDRMNCRTENRDNLRKKSAAEADLGFRIIRED